MRPKYTLLVIDDEWRTREQQYRTTLEATGLIALRFLESCLQLERASSIGVDGYVVDVFLDLDGWRHTASDVYLRHLRLSDGTYRGPVFLVTRHWDRTTQLGPELEQAARAYYPVRDFFQWGHFVTTSNDEVRYKMLRALDEWHDRSALELAEDDSFRILHLSELRFGRFGRPVVSEAVLATWLRARKKVPHILIVSGDTAYSGRPSQFAAAEDWIRLLSAELWGEGDWRERVFVVAGNRDVVMTQLVIDDYSFDFEKGELRRRTEAEDEVDVIQVGELGSLAFSPFNDFLRNVSLRLSSPDQFWHSERFLHLGIVLFGLNSVGGVRASRPETVEVPLKGLLRLRSRRSVRAELSPGPFVVVVCHHGPDQVENATDVENFLESVRVDLLLHGHGRSRALLPLGAGTSRSSAQRSVAPGRSASRSEPAPGCNLVELQRSEGIVHGGTWSAITMVDGQILGGGERDFSVDVSGAVVAVAPEKGSSRKNRGRGSEELNKSVGVDFGILTVVPVETSEVVNTLNRHKAVQGRGGSHCTRSFYEGILPGANSRLFSVVCTQAIEQGNRSIMSAYDDLVLEHSPTVVALVGIGGSINIDASVGDVVIADQVVYYEKRKVRASGDSRRGISFRVEPWLEVHLNDFFVIKGESCSLPSHHSTKPFRVLRGPIGTGEAVVGYRDAAERKWLLDYNDKTLVLETEAAGLAQAFFESSLKRDTHTKGVLVIRGVSDRADRRKNDRYRARAAANAATALEALLSTMEGFRH